MSSGLEKADVRTARSGEIDKDPVPTTEGMPLCLVNSNGLPTELLTHIFYLGTRDSDDLLPFPALVSHVCRLWRNVAIGSPSLWTTITFSKRPQYERSKIWIERSKNLPIEITQVVSSDEDTVTVDEILDIIVPHVTRWRKLDVFVDNHVYIENVLIRLAQCDSAPLLETLILHYFNLEGFRPPSSLVPFHGNAPRLSYVTLVEVSIDWSSSLLHDLVGFELMDHGMDACPTWADFSRILRESPRLTDLRLYRSGPAEPPDWHCDPIELPSLETLSLSHYDAIYLSSLFRLLSMPNLKTFAIDVINNNSFIFILQLAMQPRSVLSRLQYLKIHDLFGESGTIHALYKRLPNLKSIYLNCEVIDKSFFTTLMESFSGGLYCPNLTTVVTSGISGENMRSFIVARAIAGIPIKRIVMGKDDDLNKEDERWLRDNVRSFERFSDVDEIDMDVQY